MRSLGWLQTATLSGVGASILLSGCTAFGARNQVKQLNDLAVYRGTVTRTRPSTSPLIVVLHDASTRSVVFYDVLLDDGAYYLVARPGRYEVIAFDDRNQNFTFDAGEPAGMLDGAPVDIGADPSAMGRITVGSEIAGMPAPDLSKIGLAAATPRRGAALGRVITLDDSMFAPEKTIDGLWNPADFIKEGRTGIYFLAPYEPEKIPVVFIHGIGGSPRELRSISAALDRTRFQPWFFHYPSGFSLDLNGWLLAQMLEELRGRLGFTRIFVVAHSMGGLVSASCMDWRARDQHPPLIELVVTISTPWLGSAAAALAPSGVAMPSWKDVTPDSAFIKKLSSFRSIDDAEYCLLFSHYGDSRLMGGGDDGTVTISSQLPYQAQNAASFIYGFEETHSTILENERLIGMVSRMVTNKADGHGAAEGLKNAENIN